jgi:hypothetical protein
MTLAFLFWGGKATGNRFVLNMRRAYFACPKTFKRAYSAIIGASARSRSFFRNRLSSENGHRKVGTEATLNSGALLTFIEGEIGDALYFCSLSAH